MRVEILGSGGATTTPRPGCMCRVCVEARAKGVPYARTDPHGTESNEPDVECDVVTSDRGEPEASVGIAEGADAGANHTDLGASERS